MQQRKILIFNSASGVVQLGITALLTFVCIPVFINKLGLELYGIFALVSVIGNLNLFVNLGLNTALTKYVAEQGRGEDSNLDIFVSFCINVSVILLISLIAFRFNNFILNDLLNIPSQHLFQAKALFNLLLISNALLFIGQSFTSVLDSLQRMYLTNIAQLLYSVFYWLGIIIVVILGYGLKEVGQVILLSSIIWFIVISVFFITNWGVFKVAFSFELFKTHAFKQLKYGVKMYTSGLIAFFNEPMFKIVISNFFGATAVAYYEIAIKIRGQFNGLFTKLLSPVFPYMSQLTNCEFLSKLVKELTTKIFILVLPICGLLILTCYAIVSVWLKTDVFNQTVFIIGITVPYLILSPTTIPIYYFLMAKGHPGKTILFQSISVIVSLATFFIFYTTLEIYAIILSNVFFYLSSYLLGVYYQSRLLDITYKPSKYSIRNLCLFLLAFAVVGSIQFFIINEYLVILLTILLILLVTFVLYKHLGIITKDDLKRYLPDNKCVLTFYDKL